MSDDDPASEDAIPVRIVEYDPGWPAQFEAIAAELWEACGREAFLRIDHVGSTSVPGLAAKPVIDLCPVVTSFEDAAALVPRIEAVGYRYRGEFGIPRRHYFVYRVPYTRHIHILEEGSDPYRRLLTFRDYLRANPDVAAEYERTKREIVATYGSRRDLYTQAKTPFIESVLRLAGYEAPAQPA